MTVRGVAAEAGWSTGSLRHYFGNQHELQSYVVQATADALRARVLPRVRRPRTEGTAVEQIASIVEEMLPLDAERREEYALWAALLHTFVDGLAAQLVNTPGEVPGGTAGRLLRSLLEAVPSR
ncbi:hypothetical protein MF672_024845 [Actinomadura sp. ATCC 31491]|uniref:TetR family transcriptional regulator n=1 Tax=Actinomadura luzonensis TaxID=2805427 RepID=A0ABT0FXB7_9ACTN|nr:hypothetical protein [Actinomadura luzonensis]MCK2216996.1 hypothetical protein [Actinomadura luzonensis]